MSKTEFLPLERCYIHPLSSLIGINIVNGSKKKIKTMAEIAHLAGVSTSTASRALQDSSLISSKTKAKVQATAQKYNYKPNLLARNLRLQKSNTLALVLPINAASDEIWSDPFVLKFLGVVGSVLRENEYDLIVLQTSTIDAQFVNRYYRSSRIDGFILLGRGQDYTYVNEMAGEGIPLVVWGPFFPDQKYCSVGINNIASAHSAVQHLINLGRRRIAIIADDAETRVSEARLRYQGYKKALVEAGLAVDPNLFASATYSAQSGSKAIHQLLQSAPDLDAVFVAYSDVVAMAAMQALQNAGKRIPEDVSVIGFDNVDIAAFSSPPLTTVSQSLQKGGVDLLIQKLLQQIVGEKTPSIMLDGELIVRESCGAHLLSQEPKSG